MQQGFPPSPGIFSKGISSPWLGQPPGKRLGPAPVGLTWGTAPNFLSALVYDPLIFQGKQIRGEKERRRVFPEGVRGNLRAGE
jgi:hypothetical protein